MSYLHYLCLFSSSLPPVVLCLFSSSLPPVVFVDSCLSSSLPPVVSRRTHDLFTLFVFVQFVFTSSC